MIEIILEKIIYNIKK